MELKIPVGLIFQNQNSTKFRFSIHPFTVSKVAADWHELKIQQHTIHPLPATANNWNRWCSHQTYHHYAFTL